MSEPAYRPPAFRAIFLGFASFIILLMIFCNLSEVVKWSGAAFLFLPDRLGILNQVSRNDVVPVFLDRPSSTVELTNPGFYNIYTNDYDLLVITDSLASGNGTPWVRITSLEAGERIPLSFITRGLRLYDTPFARGRPVLYFEITTPGQYKLTHPARKADIFIVPDYTTGREGELFIFFAVQIAALAYFISIPVRYTQRKNKEKILAIQNLKKTIK